MVTWPLPQQFFFKLGSKPEQLEQSGPFGGKKPPFWERQQVCGGSGRGEGLWACI